MKNTPTRLLLVLFVISTTLTGLAQATDQFPAEARPLILVGGILGSSISGALAFFMPQVKPPRVRMRRKKQFATTALALVLVSAQMACGADTLQVVKRASEEVAVTLAGAGALVNTLALEGLITPEAAAEKREAFARLSAKYAALDSELQGVTKLDADAALALVPAAEAFVAQLGVENLVPLASPEVTKRFTQAAALLRVISARILARLRSRSVSVATAKRETAEFVADARRLSALLSA